MLVNTQTTHSNPQNFILETGRDWVKSELVLSSSPSTPELGTYFILILCWRDGQTCTGGRHEEGTRRDKGICKNLLESSSPKLAKITLRHEEISCEHATSYKEPQNHSMAWSGSAEGKELQQLVWILKYVWIKNNQSNTCSRPTNLQRASRQPQSRNKAQSGSLADSPVFPLQSPQARDPRRWPFLWHWVWRPFLPSLFISASPCGPQSSYNKFSGHLWLLWNGVTQPGYTREGTSFICSQKLIKPWEKTKQNKTTGVRKDASLHTFT